MRPNDYGIEAVKEMLSEGHDVFLVSAPDPNCTDLCAYEKVQWVVDQLGVEWKQRLILTRDKTLIRGDILFDDKPTVVDGLMEPIWRHVFFTQPYNKRFDDRPRIDKWQDWRRALDEASVEKGG